MSEPLDLLLREPFTRLSRRYLQLLASGSVSLAEFVLLLAITDKTVSWKRLWETLSYSDLQDATGLSRQKVADGLAALLDQERIVRKPLGRSFTYALVPHGMTAAQLLAHCDRASGVDISAEIVNSVDRHQSTHKTDRDADTYIRSKEPSKKGLRPVDKSTSSRGRAAMLVDVGPSDRADSTCSICAGSGWVHLEERGQLALAHCPCTTR